MSKVGNENKTVQIPIMNFPDHCLAWIIEDKLPQSVVCEDMLGSHDTTSVKLPSKAILRR